MTPAPDFRHVETWVFDLDNTLYPAASDLFAQIDARMRAYLMRLLDLDEAAAQALQKRYYREHGTTLNGLMLHHNADPHAYLDFVHDIDLSVLAPAPNLSQSLARLPGRRIVFTNGSRNHAERVLERLGLAHQFEGVFDIIDSGFCPKPDTKAFDAFLAAHAIAPSGAAMFEDIARNLVPAHDLGMTTVLVLNASPWSKQGPSFPQAERHHIHHETEDLAQFLAQVQTKDDRS